MIRIGLRFASADAAFLRAVARQITSGQRQGEATGGLTLAADAAETGEPLIMQCDTPQEAHQMAAKFVRLGCTMPAIEELTGHRPSR
jgi:hypothetical protein